MIQLSLLHCINVYGSNPIDKVPGAVCFDITKNIIRCSEYMNQEIMNIGVHIRDNYDVSHREKLVPLCYKLLCFWSDINSWYHSYKKDPTTLLVECISNVCAYIEHIKSFAEFYNSEKVQSDKSLYVNDLINNFIDTLIGDFVENK